MAEFEQEIAPANLFVLFEDEAYAGISKTFWKAIVYQLEILKAVELDDTEPENKECDICRERFISPADDGSSSEKPVSIPCGHVFGEKCLSEWIALDGGRDPREHDENGNEEVREWFRVNLDNLVPSSAASLKTKAFTCPKCRMGFNVLTKSAEQALSLAIQARLRFWDRAYKKLGIVRSVEEEKCRQDLGRFVQERKVEQETDSRYPFKWRAQASAMRFALRRARWDLTPVQRDLSVAFFNLGCCGVSDSQEYYAYSYENLLIPFWCWYFKPIERGMNLSCNPSEPRGQENINWRLKDWKTGRLGVWRRTLFAEIVNDQWYESNRLWDGWYVR